MPECDNKRKLVNLWKTPYTLILAALIILLPRCDQYRQLTHQNYHIRLLPPGSVKIADNFYCDRSELSNIGWREYVHWTKRIFGADSEAFLVALPDTTVWLVLDSCLHQYADEYFRDPKYDDFPVVGITQQQAMDYAQWRSDRVMEKLLIDFGVIRVDHAQTSETYFTVERFFNGELNTRISDKEILYYPQFRLPTLEERRMILLYADRLNDMYFKRCNSEYCRDCKTNYPEFLSDVMPCAGTEQVPVRSGNEGCVSQKSAVLYNVRGNVSEWTALPHTTAGGGWNDSRDEILQSDVFRSETPNAWTGFRNVSGWKRWEEE